MLAETARKFGEKIKAAQAGDESALRFLRELMREVADSAPAEELILLCRYLYSQQAGVRN